MSLQIIDYFQGLVTIIVAGSVILKLLNDMYKTTEKKKKRKGLLELNGIIPRTTKSRKEKNQQYQAFFPETLNIKEEKKSEN